MEEQMQAGGMTVKDMQQKMRCLENEINQLIQKFESEIQMQVSLGIIRLHRDTIKITIEL